MKNMVNLPQGPKALARRGLEILLVGICFYICVISYIMGRSKNLTYIFVCFSSKRGKNYFWGHWVKIFNVRVFSRTFTQKSTEQLLGLIICTNFLNFWRGQKKTNWLDFLQNIQNKKYYYFASSNEIDNGSMGGDKIIIDAPGSKFFTIFFKWKWRKIVFF